MFYRVLIFAFFVTLLSCSGEERVWTEAELGWSEIISNKFDSTEALVYEDDTLLAGKEVLNFYKEQGFLPIWTSKNNLTTPGSTMLNLVDSSYDHGFLPEMFHAEQIHKNLDSSFADVEMLLSNAFYLFITHIQEGCIDSSDYSYVWKKDSIDFLIEDELNRVVSGEPVDSVIIGHAPVFRDYQQLQKGLARFLDTYQLDTNQFIIPSIKDDSAACYDKTKEVLMAHGFADSLDLQTDSIFIERLKAFQKINGLKDDAVVGKWTSRALEKSNMDRFYQAAVSLEKWRWKSAYPDRYIRVNIPEYSLYFYNGDTLKAKHRVIVGAYATQTPEFHATMRRMVTNPFWHVPYSISSTEILYAARRDTAYFGKKGYKLFKSGNQVDPTTVDWSKIKQWNFPYRVRQDGGSGNSLGRIKFLFPNPHSVFVHDTPTKRLFMNDVRAYSHGCVRLHQPFDLAKVMLETDQHEVVRDTLDSLIIRGTQQVLELNDPFDVFIEYISATGDSSSHIRFHPDVYGRDERYADSTFRKIVTNQ